MVVGFTTACAISAYHHQCYKFESRSLRGIFGTTLCDKVCQWNIVESGVKHHNSNTELMASD